MHSLKTDHGLPFTLGTFHPLPLAWARTGRIRAPVREAGRLGGPDRPPEGAAPPSGRGAGEGVLVLFKCQRSLLTASLNMFLIYLVSLRREQLGMGGGMHAQLQWQDGQKGVRPPRPGDGRPGPLGPGREARADAGGLEGEGRASPRWGDPDEPDSPLGVAGRGPQSPTAGRSPGRVLQGLSVSWAARFCFSDQEKTCPAAGGDVSVTLLQQEAAWGRSLLGLAELKIL